ncbi:MAG: hypothetical protein JHC33_13475 [Ignisphaera sp.]|nr:hypothetical protein [Ignisphaera sp.]
MVKQLNKPQYLTVIREYLAPIKKYNLTLESYLECDELFSMDNAVVLTETEHRKFHSIYNKTTTASDWFLYIEKNTVKLTELNL